MAQLIYIGVLPEMDTDESNSTNENPGAVQGTYNETQMQGVTVSMSDNFDPGVTYNDDFNMQADTFTYDLGSGSITSGLDGEARFFAEVIRAGSTTPESIQISVYQLQNGATFVRLPDGYKINQLTIQGMSQDGFDGITTNASSNSTVVCFVSGTWIETTDGPRKVEDLNVGDLVQTEDNGAQPIIWVGSWQVKTQEKTTPVRIASGALGAGHPFSPLMVSRQHRIFVTSPVAQHMFGDSGALVAAHRMVHLPGVTLGPCGQTVTYHHLQCAQHQLIRANGVPVETLLNASETRSVLHDDANPPKLAPIDCEPVRPLHSAKKQRRYIERLAARAARMQQRKATMGKVLVDASSAAPYAQNSAQDRPSAP